MIPIVILEGPDGAGKTTLAQTAFADYNYAHLSAPKGDALQELAEHVDATLARCSAVVFDRLHLSEQVYGYVYRNGGLRPMDFLRVEEWLRARGAVVVLCLPAKHVAMANWAARSGQGDEMYGDRYERVWSAYKAVGTRLPLVTHDYTWNDPDSTRRLVDNMKPPAREPQGRLALTLTEYLF